jgi:hypothetical protein
VKRDARLRHSRSPQGRADHADHQRAYRMRQRLRVMDLGSRKLAISESVDRPDVPSAAMLAIALEDVGQKGQDETTEHDSKDASEVPAETAETATLQPTAKASQVVCTVCGALGRFVREHYLRSTRVRRRAGASFRQNADAWSG